MERKLVSRAANELQAPQQQQQLQEIDGEEEDDIFTMS